MITCKDPEVSFLVSFPVTYDSNKRKALNICYLILHLSLKILYLPSEELQRLFAKKNCTLICQNFTQVPTIKGKFNAYKPWLYYTCIIYQDFNSVCQYYPFFYMRKHFYNRRLSLIPQT